MSNTITLEPSASACGWRFCVERDGIGLISGSVPFNRDGNLGDQATWAYYMRLAIDYNGSLWVAPINTSHHLDHVNEPLFCGKTWAEIDSMQQGTHVPKQIKSTMPDGAVKVDLDCKAVWDQTCGKCHEIKPDVEERYSYGVPAGRMCVPCCGSYRDNCGIDQPQGNPADLDETIEPEDY